MLLFFIAKLRPCSKEWTGLKTDLLQLFNFAFAVALSRLNPLLVFFMLINLFLHPSIRKGGHELGQINNIWHITSYKTPVLCVSSDIERDLVPPGVH